MDTRDSDHDPARPEATAPEGTTETAPRRFAIVAVHGVAYHPPGETARLVADLLLRPEHTPASVVYSPYDEATVRIPVTAIAVPPAPSDEESRFPKGSRFDERSSYVRSRQAEEPPAVASDGSDRDAFGFMRSLLRHYQPRNDDKVYETQRLRSTRTQDGDDVEVHVHEMYWSDLSRLGTGALRILGELFQLLFHLASLGRQTADFAWIAHAGHDRSRPWWCSLQFCVTWAARMLTLPIPILNMLLLAVVLMPLPGYFLSKVVDPASVAIAAVIAAAATVFVLSCFRRVLWLLWLLLPPIAMAATGFLANLAIQPFPMKYLPFGGFQLLALESCAALAAAVAWLILAFDRARPGVASIGAWLGAVTFLFGVLPQVLMASNSWTGILLAAIKVVEIIFLFLLVAWFFMVTFTWLAAACAMIAVLLSPNSDSAEHSRSVRAAGTSCVALSVPALLSLVTALVLYRALSRSGAYVFPEGLDYYPSWVLVDYFDFKVEMPAIDFLNNLIVASATPAFVVSLIMLATAVVMIIWALLPAALSDARPPASSAVRSDALGNWLCNGYRLLNWVGVMFFLAFPVVLTIGSVVQLTNRRYGFLRADTSTPYVLEAMAAVVVGAVGGLLAFGGQLERFALGFRPFLNIVLDVDNYLREYPRDNNPRSRICCRFASLLRYLSEWRDPRDQGGYEGLIIIAHSQGTVISVELLRFLQHFPEARDTALDRYGKDIPVALFTMGCPLRQLYGWRFPHLFAWARHEDPAAWTPGNPAFIPNDRMPDPSKLGVECWVNAFRSGDYIGRHLWRSDDCNYQYTPTVSEDSKGQRREFCIGAGGHIHYFDDTAPEIAAELDRLIAKMAGLQLPDAVKGLEVLEQEEEALKQSILHTSEQLLDETQRPVRRDQHPKQHACVEAQFVVADDLPDALRVGIFSQPGHGYDAVIRFSNGREFDDTHSDIHGMAIKLLGVPGKKMLEHEADATTQDFVLIDYPVFFIRNLTDYAPFSRLVLDLKGLPRFYVVARLGWFFFARGQWQQFRILMRSRGKRISNPLTTRYWSTTPYRFGKHEAVKYSARPHGEPTASPVARGPDYLREAMVVALGEGREASFDFLIQLQEDPRLQPIEDPTVEWATEWIKVATIRIPAQSIDESISCEECENLSFTPWHSLPEHRPLGGINRVRRLVYERLSARRHDLNKAPTGEPQSLETSDTP